MDVRNAVRRRFRNRSSIPVVIAATLGLSMFTWIPAQAAVGDTGVISGPAEVNRCIDVAGADSRSGTPVGLFDCNGTSAQQWTVSPDGSLRALGKCLDATGNGTAAGTKIQLWDCTGGGAQQWVARSNGSLLNPQSGRCLDDPAGILTNGIQLQIWDCNNEWPQVWHLPGGASSGGGTGSGPGTFGNTTIHPEKLGIYAIPDMDYGDLNTVQASFAKLHSLLPRALVRWDQETGHYRETPGQVEDYIRRANDVGLPMIIAACCVDGYDNYWARGGSQPTVSIRQIADGPYLSFADRMRRTYPNVQYVETINEPDTSWFVSDPDNGEDWNYYLSKLYSASGADTAHLMGPASAFRSSSIWNNVIVRNEIRQVSYHTYGGWSSLSDVGGKDGVWVTEYGDDRVSDDVGHSPGYELADLWQAERAGKLSGNIRQLFYVNLQGMMSANAQENGHYAFSGQLRGLAAYQALGNISTSAYLDANAPDFLAADDGRGAFGVLFFNSSPTSTLTRTATVPGTSLGAGTPLYELRITNQQTGSGTCRTLGSQNGVSMNVTAAGTSATVNDLPPLSAVLVSTTPCGNLAD